jgi:hypothetical protein
MNLHPRPDKKQAIQKAVLKILAHGEQPPAAELLAQLDARLGTEIRWQLIDSIESLANDRRLTHGQSLPARRNDSGVPLHGTSSPPQSFGAS